MQHLETFKTRHAFAHRIFYAPLFHRYSETELRRPVNHSTNSLAWLIWHVARVEDAGVTRFVTGEEQLLFAEGWHEKLNIQISHYGYGASREEMLLVSQEIDLGALAAYFESVRSYTINTLSSVSPDRLNESLSQEEVSQVLYAEGVALPHVTDALDIYTGWTRQEALYHFSLLHYYWHGGEVRTIEGLMNLQAIAI